MDLNKQLKSSIIIRSTYDSLVKLKNMSGKQRQRFGVGITRDFKDLVFIYAIFIISIICVIMLILYRKEFGMSLSPDSDDWGNFGTYLGSITGLLAFLGVLYTIRQSKEQAESSEERGVFFKMLELYQKKADSIIYKDVTGVKAVRNIISNLNDDIAIYIVCNEILTNDNFKLSENKDYFDLQLDIAKCLDLNSGFDLNSIGGYEELTYIQKNSIVELMKQSIDLNFRLNIIIEPKNFIKNKTLYYEYANELLIRESSNGSVLIYIYKIMKDIADNVYKQNEQYLGQYFRNIINLLDMTSNFKDREKYSEIFRAQFSKSEIALLLYYAVSNKSNDTIVDLLIDNEMFKDIDPGDVYFYHYWHIFNASEINVFIKELLNTYKLDLKRRK